MWVYYIVINETFLPQRYIYYKYVRVLVFECGLGTRIFL